MHTYKLGAAVTFNQSGWVQKPCPHPCFADCLQVCDAESASPHGCKGDTAGCVSALLTLRWRASSKLQREAGCA